MCVLYFDENTLFSGVTEEGNTKTCKHTDTHTHTRARARAELAVYKNICFLKLWYQDKHPEKEANALENWHDFEIQIFT
jgi:hypothetical protein